MPIIELLKDTANGLSSPVSFGHGEREWQNLIADMETAGTTLCYLDEPLSSVDTLTTYGSLLPTYRISLVFGRLSHLHNDSNHYQQQVVGPMRELAAEYVLRLKSATDQQGNPLVSRLAQIQRTDFYNLFDSNLAGCMLQLRLIPCHAKHAALAQLDVNASCRL